MTQSHPLVDVEPSELTWRFLNCYFGVNSGLSASQALAKTLRHREGIQRIELLVCHCRKLESPSWEKLSWADDSMPESRVTDSEPPMETNWANCSVSLEYEADQNRAVLYILAEPRISDKERREIEGLLHIILHNCFEYHQKGLNWVSSAGEFPTETGVEFPLTYAEDLRYLRKRLEIAYRNYRTYCNTLYFKALEVTEDFACYFLLYDSSSRALWYPVTDFFRLTDAGRVHIEAHLERIGASWDELICGDNTIARRLVVDLFVEVLNEKFGQDMENEGPAFIATVEGTEIAAVPCVEQFELHEHFAKWVNTHVLMIEQEMEFLAGVENVGEFAETLLAAVLSRLPQGLSVGVASRCFITASSLIYRYLAARGVGKTVATSSYLESLFYTLIICIERHFMVGSFRHWPHLSPGHAQPLNDPDETLVAMVPLLSRGQPLGVFFILERRVMSPSKQAALLERMAFEFCNRNAEVVSDLIQRVREANFLRLCQQQIARLMPSEGVEVIFQKAIVPNLCVFLNVVECHMFVAGKPEWIFHFREVDMGTRCPFAFGECSQYLRGEHSRLGFHKEHIRIYVGSEHVPIDFDIILEMLDTTGLHHHYEWISVLSEAYKHSESSQQGVRAVGATLATLVDHHADRDVYAEWSRMISRVADSLSSAKAKRKVPKEEDLVALRYVSWEAGRHSHQRYEHLHEEQVTQHLGNKIVRIQETLKSARAIVYTVIKAKMSGTNTEKLAGKLLDNISITESAETYSIYGCGKCIEYAFVEALINAIKAVAFSYDQVGQLPQPTITFSATTTEGGLLLCFDNWHAFGKETPKFKSGREIATYLRANPVPRLGATFREWRERYIQWRGRSPERPGGVVGDIAWCVAAHGGHLCFDIGDSCASLQIILPSKIESQ